MFWRKLIDKEYSNYGLYTTSRLDIEDVSWESHARDLYKGRIIPYGINAGEQCVVQRAFNGFSREHTGFTIRGLKPMNAVGFYLKLWGGNPLIADRTFLCKPNADSIKQCFTNLIKFICDDFIRRLREHQLYGCPFLLVQYGGKEWYFAGIPPMHELETYFSSIFDLMTFEPDAPLRRQKAKFAICPEPELMPRVRLEIECGQIRF